MAGLGIERVYKNEKNDLMRLMDKRGPRWSTGQERGRRPRGFFGQRGNLG